MNKTEKALEIFNSMPGQARKEVVAAIAQGLKTTKPNASTYYSKVAKMTAHHVAAPEICETDDEIRDRIRDRFEIMDRMTQGVVDGVIRSMIVFGAPGGAGRPAR